MNVCKLQKLLMLSLLQDDTPTATLLQQQYIQYRDVLFNQTTLMALKKRFVVQHHLSSIVLEQIKPGVFVKENYFDLFVAMVERKYYGPADLLLGYLEPAKRLDAVEMLKEWSKKQTTSTRAQTFIQLKEQGKDITKPWALAPILRQKIEGQNNVVAVDITHPETTQLGILRVLVFDSPLKVAVLHNNFEQLLKNAQKLDGWKLQFSTTYKEGDLIHLYFEMTKY